MSTQTLIQHVRIFDGASVIAQDGSVMINAQSGRIEQIWRDASDSSPDTDHLATVIDGTGCTLIPGLIDAHVHAHQDLCLLERAIRYGVTTVLDLHNERDWFQELKQVAERRRDVADIKSACLSATVAGGWPTEILSVTTGNPELKNRTLRWPNLTDQQSIDEWIVANQAAGASFVKLMQEDGCFCSVPFSTWPIPTPSLELQKRIVDTAHRNNLLAVAHAMSNHATLRVLAAGADGVAHSSMQPVTDEIVQAFKATNAFVIPTLTALASCTGDEPETRERIAQTLQGTEKEHVLGCVNVMREGYSVKACIGQVTALKEAGIDVICGTDTATPLPGMRAGASVYEELWMYVHRCGFTPIEALASATSKTVDRFGFSDRGRIEEGRLADLVLVEGDPTQSIEALWQTRKVWRNGDLLKAV
ncbi:hypothetical protein N7492_003451 [Penicillium capsulatum]|uniref:Amidohydrolase-related domain-containing protein n=1 Tax=Penicillium capsulatum TaxID=69766 RepID=A0A9W9IR55_9EURO|nr:hypothetical protein N7492_003451 [Penicillium capsulatum]KAJ6121967.1 hypothetical protein N7512_004432 [Penicillium capsulatum]